MSDPARRQHSYDEECERLARHFLADDFAAHYRNLTPPMSAPEWVLAAAARDLAQEIQECNEGWRWLCMPMGWPPSNGVTLRGE